MPTSCPIKLARHKRAHQEVQSVDAVHCAHDAGCWRKCVQWRPHGAAQQPSRHDERRSRGGRRACACRRACTRACGRTCCEACCEEGGAGGAGRDTAVRRPPNHLSRLERLPHLRASHLRDAALVEIIASKKRLIDAHNEDAQVRPSAGMHPALGPGRSHTLDRRPRLPPRRPRSTTSRLSSGTRRPANSRTCPAPTLRSATAR